jgi:hypothetical protein
MDHAIAKDDAHEPAPTGEAAAVYESAVHLTEVMRANSEAFVQAWSTTMRGVLSYQEHLLRFFGTRMQKDLDMVKGLAGPQFFQQIIDQQTAYGRTMVEDYMQESQNMLESALDIFREGARPIEERAEEAPQEIRQAVAS